jgi:hypothetical protein
MARGSTGPNDDVAGVDVGDVGDVNDPVGGDVIIGSGATMFAPGKSSADSTILANIS